MTFIKAAEIWVVNPAQRLLEFGAGVFGPAMAFATLSRSMCFGQGEGLPGQTWEQGRPILLPQFENTYFQRARAARASGLTCAIALPFFDSGVLVSVLVIYCGYAAEQAGALELWQGASTKNSRLALADGAYSPGMSAFDSASREITFAAGDGLPGRTWAQGEAQFQVALSTPSAFARSALADQADLVRGLALPVDVPGNDAFVLTFLASAQLPLARRIEFWVANGNQGNLRRSYAFSELHGGHSRLDAFLSLSRDGDNAGGSIASAWQSGSPGINELPASEPGPAAAAATSAGATALLSIPIKRAGVTTQVLALYI